MPERAESTGRSLPTRPAPSEHQNQQRIIGQRMAGVTDADIEAQIAHVRRIEEQRREHGMEDATQIFNSPSKIWRTQAQINKNLPKQQLSKTRTEPIKHWS